MFRDPKKCAEDCGDYREFRQKGVNSPDKALTLEELGLPPRFELLPNLIHFIGLRHFSCKNGDLNKSCI
jgi:hypothetical protein